MRRRRDADLLCVAALAGVGALVVELVPYAGARLAFVLPMALVLPGYALTAAAFGPRPPEPAHRLALTLGLSLTASILGALVLNLIPYGLRDRSWSLLIVVLVWIACAVAMPRRESLAPTAAPVTRAWRVRPRDTILMVLATAIAVGALIFAGTPLPAKNVQGYTTLSMLPDATGRAEVDIEVVSAELTPVTYRLEVRSGSHLAFVAPRIGLRPGQRWDRIVAIAPAGPGRKTKVEAVLARIDDAKASYRTVRVFLSPLRGQG